MVNFIIDIFIVSWGVYLLFHHSGEKSFEVLVRNYGEEEAIKKRKNGKIGGGVLIILGLVSYYLSL